MTTPLDIAKALGALVDEAVAPLRQENAELRARLDAVEAGRAGGAELSVEQLAEETGETIGAWRKRLQREEQRQAKGEPPKFKIVRRGRAVYAVGAVEGVK